ncbi:MAG: hypothetical protein HY060_23790 [Proteobacteria bacterium]|nr:hypothetical protein [Pseudomonadota bacterium]
MAIALDTTATVRRPAGRARNWRAHLAAWLKTRAARRELLRYQAIDRRFAQDIGLTPEELAYTPLKGWPQRSW